MRPPIDGPATGRGITLVELACGVALAGLLASLWVSAWQDAMRSARRGDGTGALLQLQLAQERHWVQARRYGSLAELAWPDRSPQGHYRLAVASADGSGFEAHAWAAGPQAADAPCKHLRLRVVDGHAQRASGPDERTANDDATNRRCWRA